MTDSLIRDDTLEAVLRSRAGEGAPSDLRAAILAAVAAEPPRVAGRRRATGHPWRLLAVAAVLLGTIGTVLFVGATRPSTVDPTPPPSAQAVAIATATPAPPSPVPTPAVATTAAVVAGPGPTARPCKPDKYVVKPGHGHPLVSAGQSPDLPPREFGAIAGVDWGTAEGDSWAIYVGSAKDPFTEAAYGKGVGLGSVVGSSADHSLLLVSVSEASALGHPWCSALYVVRSDGSDVVVLRDGTSGILDGEAAMGPTGLVAIIDRSGPTSPTLRVLDSQGHVRADDLHPCPAAFDPVGRHLLAWSTDSTRLAVRCAPGVVAIVRPVDGSIAEVSDLHPLADPIAMTWTSDGATLRLADVVASELRIDAVDPATNAVASTMLVDRHAMWDRYGGGGFSPSGRRLLAGTGGPPYDAYFVDPATGVTREVPDCAGGATCMWASDTTITLPTDLPRLVSVPDLRPIATWQGGFSFFTLLP